MAQALAGAVMSLPFATHDQNIRTLARQARDRITNAVGATLTLSNKPAYGTELVFKNGALLDPSTAYTLSDATLTLAVAAIAGDVFVVLYHFRAT